MRYLELRFPPPLVGITVAAVMWVTASLPPLWPPSSSVRLLAGVILLVIGIAIALSAVISFRRAQTTVNPLKPETSTSLVLTGIFARTRNPMYLGMLIGLMAWAVYLASAFCIARAGSVRPLHHSLSDSSRGKGNEFTVRHCVYRVLTESAQMALRPAKRNVVARGGIEPPTRGFSVAGHHHSGSFSFLRNAL